MLCQACNRDEAVVYLTTQVAGPDGKLGPEMKLQYCQDCADAYFASTPDLNSCRGLIQLSDRYRSKIYDHLEAQHPEVFSEAPDNAERCRHAEIMEAFLRAELKREGMELNDVAFGMLVSGFIGSAEFYERQRRRH